MKNVTTHQQEITLGKEARTSVFVSEYSESVQITLRDKDKHDETHVIELDIPLEIARNLICELVPDLAEHDEKKAQEVE